MAGFFVGRRFEGAVGVPGPLAGLPFQGGTVGAATKVVQDPSASSKRRQFAGHPFDHVRPRPRPVCRNNLTEGYQGLSSLSSIHTHKGTVFNTTQVGSQSAPPKRTVAEMVLEIRSAVAFNGLSAQCA